MSQNIHREAIAVFGLRARLRKLGMESTEVSNVLDRYEEGKATFADILHEVRDFLYVWHSVTESDQFHETAQQYPWYDHEVEAEKKLRKAIGAERAHEGRRGKPCP